MMQGSTWLLWVGFLWAQTGPSSPPQRPPIDEQVVFLYYRDLEPASQFYEEILGLELTFSLEWVRIYRSRTGALVGLVRADKGFFGGDPQTEGVMLSWVTSQVDAWHAFLSQRGVPVLKPPRDSQETGTRSFVFSDPGGYKLEFFQWLR